MATKFLKQGLNCSMMDCNTNRTGLVSFLYRYINEAQQEKLGVPFVLKNVEMRIADTKIKEREKRSQRKTASAPPPFRKLISKTWGGTVPAGICYSVVAGGHRLWEYMIIYPQSDSPNSTLRDALYSTLIFPKKNSSLRLQPHLNGASVFH